MAHLLVVDHEKALVRRQTRALIEWVGEEEPQQHQENWSAGAVFLLDGKVKPGKPL